MEYTGPVAVEMSYENAVKMDALVEKTGIADNNLIGLGLDIAKWVAEKKTNGYSIVAITADSREPMPEFFGSGQLRFN